MFSCNPTCVLWHRAAHAAVHQRDAFARSAGWALLVWAVVIALPIRAQTINDSGSALHLADQRLLNARLVDITEDGDFSFSFQPGDKAKAETRTFDSSEIVRWGRQRTSGGSALVWLSDGSWLAGQLEWKSEQAFTLTSDWFSPIDFQIHQVRGLVLQPSPSIKRIGELEKEMLRATGSADFVWNLRSEQLSGVLTLKLESAIEPELPPSAIWLLKTPASVEPIELESEAVQAIVFSPILRRPMRSTSRTVHLDLRDGSHLNVTAMGRSPEGRVTLTLADNRVLEALDSSAQFASAIARITSEPERVVWLGALEPARYRFAETPGELTWPLGRDEDLFGRPLSVADESVPHGIAMHAPSQAAYRWDGRAAKFLAEVGLYTASGGSSASVGSVECKVLVARQGQLVEVFRSPVLRPTSPAVLVEADISDAQLVVLLVEQADQGPVGDHVLWRDARLVPSVDAQNEKK